MAKHSNPTIQEIRLCEIRCDKTQSRAKIDSDTVQDYAEVLRDGGTLPPMTVFFDGSDYWLGDGFHRHGAAQSLGWETYPCDVRSGSVREALVYSLSANQHHGLRRTNDDKRHAVELALDDEEWREWSNVQVAMLCGVSNWLVIDVRRIWERKHQGVDSTSSSKKSTKTRLGSDGKRYPASPKKKKEPAAPDDSFDTAAIEAQPHPTVDIAGLSAPYKQSVLEIGVIANRVKEIAAEERTGGHLASKLTRILHDLNEAKVAISEAEPVCVCPKCDGDGCNPCAHTGFWTRAIRKSRKSA